MMTPNMMKLVKKGLKKQVLAMSEALVKMGKIFPKVGVWIK